MSTRRKSLLAFLVVPIFMLVSLAAVGVANARQSHQAAPLRTPTITISMFTFNTPLRVRHGVNVRVVNRDAVTHTVTSNKAGKFNVVVPARSTAFFRAPSTAGRYGFHCNIHPQMTGILRVR
ncbi:MAG: hypothetical protein QOI06_1210 [Nocardioidaceae bacterium]|jgi:plastocyanin|nr:hypothetical protein [Nocardioidaceae bacterium]